MCVFNFSPGNVTGCPGNNNCIGHHCTLPNRCLVDCHDNCKHECGQRWSRQSRWNDEEECVNECDANCSENCRNNGNKRSAAMLDGKYLLNIWILLLLRLCSTLQAKLERALGTDDHSSFFQPSQANVLVGVG